MKYNNRSLFLCLCFALLSVTVVQSFSTQPSTKLTTSTATTSTQTQSHVTPVTQLFMGGVDPSKSGTKTGRMKQLAEMEKLGSKDDGDKSVFIKAAGGLAAFIVIAIAAAAASGLLTQY